MSEKHLTELPWKALAVKKKLKETDLTKALVAYNRAEEDDYDARGSALNAIEKAATALRKEHKADSDLNGYLGDVIAETGKAHKAIEEAKSKGDDEDEGSVDPKVIKKRMVSLLGQVKSAAPDGPQMQFMACAAGATDSAVLLGRNVGAAQKKALLGLVPGGGKFIQGDCIWEENAHTFVTDALPGGFAKKMSTAIFHETGVKYKVRARKPDGTGAVDSDTEVDPDEQKVSNPPAPPTRPVVNPQAQAQFVSELSALKPELNRVLASKPPIAGELAGVTQKMSERAKAQDFAAALEHLTQLTGLVKTGLEQMSQARGGDPGAVLKERITKLLPRIKQAIAANSPNAAEIRLKISEAGALGKQGSYGEANAAVDSVEKLLEANQETPKSTSGSETQSTAESQTPGGPPPQEKEEKQTPDEPVSGGEDEEANWYAQSGAMEDDYTKAMKGGTDPESERLKTRLKTIWAFAAAQAEKGDYKKAGAALDRIKSEKLFESIAQLAGAGQPNSGNLVAKRKFLLSRWKEIPKQLKAELAALTKKMAADVTDEDTSDLASDMDKYVDDLLTDLQDKIDAGINSGDMASLKGLRGEFSADPFVSLLSENPFKPDVGAKFESLVGGYLDEVESNLAA